MILLRARQTQGTGEPSLGSPDDVGAIDLCDEESDEKQYAHMQAEPMHSFLMYLARVVAVAIHLIS